MKILAVIVFLVCTTLWAADSNCDWKKLQSKTKSFVLAEISLYSEEPVKNNGPYRNYQTQRKFKRMPDDLASKIAQNIVDNLRSSDFYRTAPYDINVDYIERVFPHSTFQEMKGGFTLNEKENISIRDFEGVDYSDIQTNTFLDMMVPKSKRSWLGDEITSYNLKHRETYISGFGWQKLKGLNKVMADILKCVLPSIEDKKIGPNISVDNSSKSPKVIEQNNSSTGKPSTAEGN